MREHEAEFRRRGARVAAIGLGDTNYATFFREETGITFPLLIDEERQAYRAAGRTEDAERETAKAVELQAATAPKLSKP